MRRKAICEHPKTGRLISPSKIPNTESLITRRMPLKDTMDRPLRNLYENTSNLRFGLNIEDNPFS